MEYKPHHTCKTEARHLFDEFMAPHKIKYPIGSGMPFRAMLKLFKRFDPDCQLLSMIEDDGDILHPDAINSLKKELNLLQ